MVAAAITSRCRRSRSHNARQRPRLISAERRVVIRRREGATIHPTPSVGLRHHILCRTVHRIRASELHLNLYSQPARAISPTLVRSAVGLRALVVIPIITGQVPSAKPGLPEASARPQTGSCGSQRGRDMESGNPGSTTRPRASIHYARRRIRTCSCTQAHSRGRASTR
jgi:hypothetical protein